MTLPQPDATFLALLGTVIVAGLAKGLSGFGSGLIMAPVIGALYGPKAALVIIVILDSLPTLPVAIPALPAARWREVLPVTVGMLLLFPLGLVILTRGDPEMLRWTVCLAVLSCALLLISGYRYRGVRNTAVSFGVGGVAGVLSGIASIPGPPLLAYWLSAELPVVMVRANLLALFLLSEIISVANLWAAGMLEGSVVGIALAASPIYIVSLMLGAKGFRLASEHTYRRITYALILLAALLAVPLFDGFYR